MRVYVCRILYAPDYHDKQAESMKVTKTSRHGEREAGWQANQLASKLILTVAQLSLRKSCNKIHIYKFINIKFTHARKETSQLTDIFKNLCSYKPYIPTHAFI